MQRFRKSSVLGLAALAAALLAPAHDIDAQSGAPAARKPAPARPVAQRTADETRVARRMIAATFELPAVVGESQLSPAKIAAVIGLLQQLGLERVMQDEGFWKGFVASRGNIDQALTPLVRQEFGIPPGALRGGTLVDLLDGVATAQLIGGEVRDDGLWRDYEAFVTCTSADECHRARERILTRAEARETAQPPASSSSPGGSGAATSATGGRPSADDRAEREPRGARSGVGGTSGGDAKGGDAKGGDAKGGDAKGDGKKGDDKKGGDAKGGGAPPTGGGDSGTAGSEREEPWGTEITCIAGVGCTAKVIGQYCPADDVRCGRRRYPRGAVDLDRALREGCDRRQTAAGGVAGERAATCTVRVANFGTNLRAFLDRLGPYVMPNPEGSGSGAAIPGPARGSAPRVVIVRTFVDPKGLPGAQPSGGRSPAIDELRRRSRGCPPGGCPDPRQ